MSSWRLKLRLPSLKTTVRPAGKDPLELTINRGCRSTTTSEGKLTLKDDEDTETTSFPGVSFQDTTGEDLPSSVQDRPTVKEPSLHEIKQKANVCAWAEIRQELMKAAVQCCAMPRGQVCIHCAMEEAAYRCLQCSPQGFYCGTCFRDSHKRSNFFHVGEIWQDGVFKPIIIQDRCLDVRLPHECATAGYRRLCCLDDNGVEHNILFACCNCEPFTVTMVRARLWPASPQHPQLAFCFSLLDWAEALLLECQVALKDLCNALFFKCPHLVNKRRRIYTAMIDAFEEYRAMKVELRQMTFMNAELDFGNICPACPKDSGKKFLSFDALFGLPRKKAAGKSFRDPLHGLTFFGDQHMVDEFVAISESRKKKQPSTQSCSDFLAGNELRSSKRYNALDETAVFGCACRHEFPHFFIDLKHGERLSYADWLLQEVVQRNPKGIQFHVMYDIACNLVKYLRNSPGSRSLVDNVKFAIPSFHAYGHKADCQVLYSPQRCNGFGLSDGEVMERLWSYLRRFGRMTKEMRPSHRTDILTHALLFYGQKTKQKLSTMLFQRWIKARKMKTVSEQTYQELVSSCEGNVVTEQLVERWLEAEKSIIVKDGCQQSITSEWKLHYFHMLQYYYITRQQISNLTTYNPANREKLLKVESKLAEFEIRCGLKQRWITTDIDYIETKRLYLKDKIEQSRSCLWSSVVRRQYLLRLKAKYADGQKIAKKLASNISKETKKASQLLGDYDTAYSQLSDSTLCPTLLPDALNLSSDFWVQQSSLEITSVPWNVRKDIIQAMLVLKRCEEELDMLQDEMRNVLTYWTNRKEQLAKCLEQYEPSLQESGDEKSVLLVRGTHGCLKRLFMEAELLHTKAMSSYSRISHTSCIPPCDDDSIASDHDTDSSHGDESEVDDEDDRDDYDF